VGDGAAGLGKARELGIRAVHRVGEDAAAAEQAGPAALRAGQEQPVVGVEVVLDLVCRFHGIDLAGHRPVVLVEVAVEVHAAPTNVVVQLAEAGERLRGDREAEPRDDGHLQQRRAGVARVDGVPARDLRLGEVDGLRLAGDEGAR